MYPPWPLACSRDNSPTLANINRFMFTLARVKEKFPQYVRIRDLMNKVPSSGSEGPLSPVNRPSNSPTLRTRHSTAGPLMSGQVPPNSSSSSSLKGAVDLPRDVRALNCQSVVKSIRQADLSRSFPLGTVIHGCVGKVGGLHQCSVRFFDGHGHFAHVPDAEPPNAVQLCLQSATWKPPQDGRLIDAHFGFSTVSLQQCHGRNVFCPSSASASLHANTASTSRADASPIAVSTTQHPDVWCGSTSSESIDDGEVAHVALSQRAAFSTVGPDHSIDRHHVDGTEGPGPGQGSRARSYAHETRGGRAR